jgi:16S rRNA (cytosine967-C5)-methyltransferase
MVDLVKQRVLTPPAWQIAAHLIARWLSTRDRVDHLMGESAPGLDGMERARVQHLVYGVIRHFSRLEAALDRTVAHPPRFITRAALFLAGYELIEGKGEPAKIVHYAVEQTKALASPAEARLVNAVGRRIAETIQSQAEPPPLAPAEALAEYYSHPVWLVRRWLALYGAESTRALLVWNQTPAPVYVRWRAPVKEISVAQRGAPAEIPSGASLSAPSALAVSVPSWLKPTQWRQFFEVPAGRWADAQPILQQGLVYIQDPAARLPIELLAPRSGEAVLDLCASPGGKSLQIADTIGGPADPTRSPASAPAVTSEGVSVSNPPLQGSWIVAVESEAERIDRLKENLALARGVETRVVLADVRRETPRSLAARGIPSLYPAVLVDVPCSNTGVMRHRVDVKWRLQEADFPRHARQQSEILAAASQFVAPGGRLVYSTCSIDPEENRKVVDAFLKKAEGFKLTDSVEAFPWTAGHDGGAAYRFSRGP